MSAVHTMSVPRSIQRIRINASAVASLMGTNPYVSVTEGLLAVWKSSDRRSWEEAHQREGVLTDDQRRVQNAKAFPSLMRDAASCTRPDDFIRRVRARPVQTMAFLPDGHDDIGHEDRAAAFRDAAEDAIRLVSTSHGDRREDDVLRDVNAMIGSGVLRATGGRPFVKTDELLVAPLGGDEEDIVLQGRVDGWVEENEGVATHLLEIKTRVHKLFRATKTYERVQCLAYLHLVPTAHSCILAEALFRRAGASPDLNINTVKRDEAMWSEIVDALRQRAALLRHIVGHPEREAVLLTKPKTLVDLCTKTGWPAQC